MLEAAGWTGSPRAKDGVEMKILYQTSTNPVRQKTQEIIKQAFESIGIPTEIKAIDAAVYFSSDAGNPDTASHFYADLEMYTNGPSSPYPISYMTSWISIDPAVDISQQSNAWAGTNETALGQRGLQRVSTSRRRLNSILTLRPSCSSR